MFSDSKKMFHYPTKNSNTIYNQLQLQYTIISIKKNKFIWKLPQFRKNLAFFGKSMQ